MKVDITSDLHIDMWVDVFRAKNDIKQRKNIKTLISNLLPDEPADVLVIAGDIGHYNTENVILFEVLRETYETVIWVHGNHDLYLISPSIEKKYRNDSFQRLSEMIQLTNQIDGVHYLNGDTIQVGGYIIGGCGSWYDNAYGSNVWEMDDQAFVDKWRSYLNDSNYIEVPYTKTREIDSLIYSEKQKKLLSSIVDVCDLVVTHVAPDWTHLPTKYQTPESTFYCFDGRTLLKRMKPNAIWVFGHTHDKHSFQHPSGPVMFCNPLGYRDGLDINSNGLSKRKFITIDLDKIPSYEELFKNE